MMQKIRCQKDDQMTRGCGGRTGWPEEMQVAQVWKHESQASWQAVAGSRSSIPRSESALQKAWEVPAEEYSAQPSANSR